MFVCNANAQKEGSVADLINASQAEAQNAHFFKIDPADISDIDVLGFDNPNEFTIRRGLPNFFRKCKNGEPVKIGFIGGSITQGDNMYRNQSANYISSLFPKVKMNGINAGVGGTGSDLGACRLQRQILAFNPDLVFIEFAVNGAYAPGVEGIIRKIIQHNPNTDICLIYTIWAGQSEIYAKGSIPGNILRLEKVAEHYNIPSIHMGMWAGFLQRDGKLVWSAPDENNGGKIRFSKDGVHPIKSGGDIYASAVARAFNVMKTDSVSVSEKLVLIDPLHENHMGGAQYLDPAELMKGKKGWDVKNISEIPKLHMYEQWFEHISTAERGCKPYKFSFEGDLLGIYTIGGPDTGAIDIFVNDKKIVAAAYDHNGKIIKYDFVDKKDERPSIINFNKYCYVSRPQYEIIKLEYGKYDIEIRPHSKPIDKISIVKNSVNTKAGRSVIELKNGKLPDIYTPQRLHLGWIMINGKEKI